MPAVFAPSSRSRQPSPPLRSALRRGGRNPTPPKPCPRPSTPTRAPALTIPASASSPAFMTPEKRSPDWRKSPACRSHRDLRRIPTRPNRLRLPLHPQERLPMRQGDAADAVLPSTPVRSTPTSRSSATTSSSATITASTFTTLTTRVRSSSAHRWSARAARATSRCTAICSSCRTRR
jgi:hypothetical protein